MGTDESGAVAVMVPSAAPDRGGLWVGEDDARHRVVVGPALAAEDVGGGHPALILADVGERPDAGDVADRPDAVGGVHAVVDLEAARVGLDAEGLQADILHARAASRGHEQLVAAQLGAVGELEDVVVAVAAGGGGVLAEVQLDAVGRQGRAERIAERLGLAREDVVHSLHEHDGGAKATRSPVPSRCRPVRRRG